MSLLGLTMAFIASVYLATVVLAIFQVLTKDNMDTEKKVFWVLVIMLTNPIGLIWYYVKRSKN